MIEIRKIILFCPLWIYSGDAAPCRGDQSPLSSHVHRLSEGASKDPFPPVGGPHQMLPCKAMVVLARVVVGTPSILYCGVITGLRSPMSYIYIDCILQPTNHADPWVYQSPPAKSTLLS